MKTNFLYFTLNALCGTVNSEGELTSGCGQSGINRVYSRQLAESLWTTAVYCAECAEKLNLPEPNLKEIMQ